MLSVSCLRAQAPRQLMKRTGTGRGELILTRLIVGDNVPHSRKEISLSGTKTDFGVVLIKADSGIIIAILGCHVLDICFAAVNSFPLMSQKTDSLSGSQISSPVNPVDSPHRTRWAEFTLSELIPGTPVYFSKHGVPTPLASSDSR